MDREKSPGGPWKKQTHHLSHIITLSSTAQAKGTNPTNISSHGTGKQVIWSATSAFWGFVWGTPFVFPTQAPAELRQATEMAGGEEKWELSSSQVPGIFQFPLPALQRTQKVLVTEENPLSLGTASVKSLPIFFYLHCSSLAGYWVCRWQLPEFSFHPPPPPPAGPSICGGDQPQALGLVKQCPHCPWCSDPAPPEWPITRVHHFVCILVTSCYHSSGLPDSPGPHICLWTRIWVYFPYWPALLSSSAALLAFPLCTYTLVVNSHHSNACTCYLPLGLRPSHPQEYPQAAMYHAGATVDWPACWPAAMLLTKINRLPDIFPGTKIGLLDQVRIAIQVCLHTRPMAKEEPFMEGKWFEGLW